MFLARRLHETRNVRRWSDVQTILDAVKKYQVDNEGDHYYEIDDAQEDEYLPIGLEALLCNFGCTAVTLDTDSVDLMNIGSEYLAITLRDPKNGDEDFPGYYLYKGSNGSIAIGVCDIPKGRDLVGQGLCLLSLSSDSYRCVIYPYGYYFYYNQY